MTIDSKAYVATLQEGNKELFEASRDNARRYFESNPSQEEMVDHFTGRMVNERMNMIEISKRVSQMGPDADPEELQMLTRQAYDEAVHFRMVKEVVEHISGKEVDLEAVMASEAAREVADGNQAKGATLLDKYEATEDEVALALYQMIGEGRAEAVWDEMAQCVEDEFISSRYAKIAHDEGFHASIGVEKLEKLIAADASVVERVEKLAPQMRADLLHISQQNTQVA
jgi:rubrerythrin